MVALTSLVGLRVEFSTDPWQAPVRDFLEEFVGAVGGGVELRRPLEPQARL